MTKRATIKPRAEANHPPVPTLGHPDQLTAKPGDRVIPSAEGSSDPDGHALSYEWFHYPEPGTLTMSTSRTGAPLKIEEFDQAKAWFVAPARGVWRQGSAHIILAVTDHGTPRLTRYRRVIVNVVQ